MKKYSQWKGIYLAWYSKEFYSDVVLNWRGVAMGYMAVLLLVLWTPVALKFQYEVNSYANGFIFPIIKQIPDLTLKENRLKMEKGSPVTIDNPRTGKPIMIFDLRDDAPRPAKDLDGMFFIGNKEILQYQGKSKEFDLSGEWKDKLITDSMISTMEKFRNYAGITFFLTYCGYSFLFTLSLIFTFGFFRVCQCWIL